MVTIVVNTVLPTWNLLRVDLKHSHHTQKMLTVWGAGCVNYLDHGNHFTMCIYIKHRVGHFILYIQLCLSMISQ